MRRCLFRLAAPLLVCAALISTSARAEVEVDLALVIAVGVLVGLLRSGHHAQGASRSIDQDPSAPRS